LIPYPSFKAIGGHKFHIHGCDLWVIERDQLWCSSYSEREMHGCTLASRTCPVALCIWWPHGAQLSNYYAIRFLASLQLAIQWEF
jgi:hypothetical protein